MKIDATTFAKLPDHLKALFIKAPNPGSDEVLAGFPQAKATGYGDGVVGTGRSDYLGGPRTKVDSGSAARFFYCAKASKRDRDEGLEGFEVRPTAASAGRVVASCAMRRSLSLAATCWAKVSASELARFSTRAFRLSVAGFVWVREGVDALRGFRALGAGS